MGHGIKVGDKVRLVGEGWREEYSEFVSEAVDGEVIVTVEDIDNMGDIWAGWAGTVGNGEGLYSSENPEMSGDYAVELVPAPAEKDDPNLVKNPALNARPWTELSLRPDSVQAIQDVADAAVHLGVQTFEQNVNRILEEIGRMLITKNRAYGNSALNPVNVFSKADRTEQIRVRIDDKLNRIRNGHEYPGDDTVNDLIGYLVLYKMAGESE